LRCRTSAHKLRSFVTEFLCWRKRVPIIGWVSPNRLVDYQRLLIDQLDRINQIAQSVGRRRHLSPADVDEFGSIVRFRLVEDDYAILRKFKGRSQIATYLVVVIDRMVSDYCDEKWGRWRPTRGAEKLGTEAVLLERLVSRDGHT